MDRNFISLIIIPHSHGKRWTFTLSRKRIKQFLIAAPVLSIAVMALLVHYFLLSGKHQDYKRLLDENARQSQTIEQYEGTINKLQETVANFESYAQKLNIMAGLKSPEVMKEVGVGDGYGDGEEQTISPPTQSLVREDLQNLNQRADEIEKNLGSLVHFFEQQSLLLASTPSIMPTKGYISSGFKMRDDPFTGRRQMHWGIDIATHHGNPILATADGVVISTNFGKIGGRTVKISHPRTGFTTVYCHLSKYNVKPGQKVKRGDVIGYVGTTGKALGPHVHYEILLNGKNVNPYKYILEE